MLVLRVWMFVRRERKEGEGFRSCPCGRCEEECETGDVLGDIAVWRCRYSFGC